ncbi:cytochrome-c peroxidase [Chitinophaga solisilvae]|uniref:cytochrome-c peroxidase n=1 Tax=Chitinophaga solisilvae TaxID=1233460 RepID=UPI00136DF82F|nr:cytochrome c peroxidase [Chitinophaga solisilvae]
MIKNMQKKHLLLLCFTVSVSFLLTQSCRKDPKPSAGGQAPEPSAPVTETGVPRLPATLYDYIGTRNNMPTYMKNFLNGRPEIDNMPAGNQITNEGATLGRVLFYDKALSVNNTKSCGSCHHQDKGFTDGLSRSPGFAGELTRRNGMPTVNLRFFKDKTMFWDLRAAHLEAQSLMPIQDMIEMGMPSLSALETKLTGIAYYRPLFKAAFGTETVTADRISRALSQFLRSIVSFSSKYDKGTDNNFSNFTAQEKNGLRLFQVNFCSECHSDLPTSTFGQIPSMLIVENTGVNTGFGSNNGLETDYTDKGIGEITHLAKDQGTFKIPALRNVELTGPYMHDGRFTTLEQVLEHYHTGIKQNPNIGIQLSGISPGIPFRGNDMADIIAFLKTLTDHSLATDPKFADPFVQ